MKFEAAHLSVLVTAAANAPLAAIRCPATVQCRIREVGISMTAAGATRLGLTRATTVSVTPSNTVPGRNHTPGAPDSPTLLVSGWATAPVVSTNYFRTIEINGQATGVIWTWPADDPLIVGDGINISEIVICNMIASGPQTFRYYFVWED